MLGNTSNVDVLDTKAIGQIQELKQEQEKTLAKFTEKYNSPAYGLAGYILYLIKMYSIPIGFVAIAIAGIYQYVIGIRKLDVRDRGFNLMIAFITILVICQILPLIYTIIVKGWVS